MKCLNCNKEKFSIKKIRFTPTIKGEQVEIILPTHVCDNCGESLMDTTQMNTLRKETADTYRKNKKLLTSKEIISLRENIGMTQSEFARFLKIGEASIKRWETYYVQDESHDEHIRLKCDEIIADQNALNIHWLSHKPDEYSGFRKFNLNTFISVIASLLKGNKSPLFLNKALFYCDFFHFKKYERSLTGLRYAKLPYGPCPDQYQSLFNYLINKNILQPSGKHDLKTTLKDSDIILDDQERETVEHIIKLSQEDGGQKLLDLSHEEKGYIQTPAFMLISYKYAKELKIA